MKKVLAFIIAVIILGLGIWLFLGTNNNSSTTSSKATPQNTKTTHSQPEVAADNAPVAVTISYTDSGFTPAQITVKSGDTVEIKNTSHRMLQMDSDPHPTHTDDPELNVGTVRPGESQKFTLTTKGTWGYHNHLNASDGGKVDVQ